MMVGPWACRVSSEIHIGGRRVSELVHDYKGKEKVAEPGDEKDPKRARVVLSKGHEVVGPGYSRLLGAATEVMHKGENSGNPNQVNRVSKTEQCYPSRVNWTDRVSQIGRDSRSDQRIDWVSRVANTERWAVENSASTGSQVTQGLGDKKLEEGKSAASSRRLAPRWCLRGITKTQKHRLQKLRRKELAEKKEEDRDYWFNHSRSMTKLKLTWQEKWLAKEEDDSSGATVVRRSRRRLQPGGTLTQNRVTPTLGRVTLTRVKRRIG
jgi:hypothetical protein